MFVCFSGSGGFRLVSAHPHPGESHPAGARGQRSAGPSSNRIRKNRSLRDPTHPKNPHVQTGDTWLWVILTWVSMTEESVHNITYRLMCPDCTWAGRQSSSPGPDQRTGPAGASHDPTAHCVLRQRRTSGRHLRESGYISTEVSTTANN